MSDSRTNMAELMQTLATARREIAKKRDTVSCDGGDAAELVAHAYSFAGRDDATCNAKGAAVLRYVQAIVSDLQDIETKVRNIQAALKNASDAVDENDAKRRQQRAKLGA